MLVRESRWLVWGENWFVPQALTSPVDVAAWWQLPQPLLGSKVVPFTTYLVRLDEGLKRRLNCTTRHEITLAKERDEVCCSLLQTPSPDDVEHFGAAYQRFAWSKSRPEADMARLRSLQETGLLWISWAYDPQGTLLVAHANVVVAPRMRALYAATLFRTADSHEQRQLMGRAARLLTVEEMVQGRDRGLRWYDFGGWYEGTDSERLRINQYKMSFGGEIAYECNCYQACSLRGRLFLAAWPWFTGPTFQPRGNDPVASPDVQATGRQSMISQTKQFVLAEANLSSGSNPFEHNAT